MIRRMLSDIAAMCGGSLQGPDMPIAGVSTDTRTIQKNNLYIPLKGIHFDGHTFWQQAFTNGAAACLWAAGSPMPPGKPVVLVDDTLLALQRLAAAYRDQLKLTVVAVTGSNGKTSTKDMLAAMLATKYKTGKNSGNKNNHIGTPLTLLEFDEDTEMGVVEMGMSALQEISLLSRLAKPDVALITNIGEAHLADLGSRENIARAKLEILDGLKTSGIFISDMENNLAAKAIKEYNGIALSYESEQGDYYPTHIKAVDRGMAFSIKGMAATFTVPLTGKHQVYNALAAAVCAKALGISEEGIASGLLNAAYTGQRGEVYQLKDHRIIDDTYKSNPASLKAAVENISGIEWAGKKAVILGDMRDLGGEEAQLHREIGRLLNPENIHVLITIGSAAKYIAQAAAKRYAPENIFILDEQEKMSAAAIINNIAKSQPVMVLVKGARALKLEEVTKALQTCLGQAE